jgi:two-component system cell cycle response regulator DivK
VRRYEWKASGWQVLEFADTMPRVDLVLMDLHLPYEDGYDALKRFRGDARFNHTTIVAITADATPTTMEKARSAGFDGFLGKPINPDKFPDQIVQILQGEAIWDLGQEA